ncbi:MAG: hypothetical protein KDB61_06245, partial [Planctomycetes bacterium]|nr:hypothetical protein [Planctomycetota bacterium]
MARHPRPHRPPSRSGSVPAWVPMVFLAAAFVWVLNSLQMSAREKGVGICELTRVRLHHEPLYFGDAWQRRVERILRRRESLDLSDKQAIASLKAELAGLSFVEEVGEPEVIWPDGLVVPLRLREPAACIRVGDDFLPVADDGMVLAGYSYAPHEVYGAWLPILGPTDRLMRGGLPSPGDFLTDEALLAALKVAGSMQRNLLPREQRILGRIVIDASHELAPDGMPGGVYIDLEGKRRILFGRAPGSDFPGELPAQNKWMAIRQALEEGEEGAPWDLLDVPWDEPVREVRGEADGDS